MPLEREDETDLEGLVVDVEITDYPTSIAAGARDA